MQKKCAKQDCEKTATRALKLEFYIAPDQPAGTVFINLPVCDEHNLTDAEVMEFIKLNWVTLNMGFEQLGQMHPEASMTKFSWAPIEEAEEFWREGMANPRTTFRKN